MKRIFSLIILVGFLGIIPFIVGAAETPARFTVFNPQIKLSDIAGGKGIGVLVVDIATFATIIAGAVATILIIWSGLVRITAGGDSSKVEESGDILWSAIIGLGITLTSVLLLNAINPDLTKFKALDFTKIKLRDPQAVAVKLDKGGPGGGMSVNGGVGGDSVVKGDFSSVTAADLRPYLGSNYSDADVQAFIDAGKQYGIDPRFLASVSKFETANGTSKAFTDGRNNAMGISNSVGPISFASVRDSIFTQANKLVKDGGPYTQATTIRQIGDIYSPSVDPATGRPYQNDVNGTNWSWTESVSSNYNQMRNGRTGN